MKSQVDPKIAVAAIVLLVAVVSFAAWKFIMPKPAITNEKGIPLVPSEAKPGADAMSKLWSTNVQPPKTK